ncbi:MAG: cation:H+ antiporter [Pseudohongiellaceae bacterium]|jgi:cation:H+ antiporter
MRDLILIIFTSFYPRGYLLEMLAFSAAIIIGLIILIWSADRFVSGAVATALKLGMTPMMVGLTIVAFGTSAPELIVSATASLSDASDLAVGNAIGSNIANIAFVLGITAMVSAIPLKKSILKVEFPVLLLATLIATLLIWDQTIDFMDGIFFLIILIISLAALAYFQQDEQSEEIDEVSENKDIPTKKAYTLLFVSIILLIGSSKLLVWGASGIALDLGVSELVIGLTIVAIGTSLPELAASIASALKGHHDLALGNIIGSNLFNLLAVLAIPAFINPPTLSNMLISRDYTFMLVLTGGLAILVYGKVLLKKKDIGKVVGFLLLASYCAYLAILYQQSVSI